MKTVLLSSGIVFSLVLVPQAIQEPAGAAAPNVADAIAWYDTLGFPNAANAPYVRVATGRSIQRGNQPPENTYIEGFLVRDGPEGFSIFVADVPMYGPGEIRGHAVPLSTATFVTKTDGPPEDRVGFEAIDLPRKAEAVLTRLRAYTSGGPSPSSWSLGLRATVFTFGRACLQRGLSAIGAQLIGIAAALPDDATGKPLTRPLRERLQLDLGDAEWWTTEEAFGDPDVSWEALLKIYEDFPGRYPASPWVREATERAALLRTMADEAQAHQPGTTARAPMADAADAIYQLRHTQAFCLFPAEFFRGAGTAVHRLVELGDAAVPALIEALDDRRFTRTSERYCAGSSPLHYRVMRVGDLARHILEFMSGRQFFPERTPNGALTATTRQLAEAWWAERQIKGEAQTLLAQAAQRGQAGRRAVSMIVEKYPAAALEAIHAGLRAAENEFARAELVGLAAGVQGDAALRFLREMLAPNVGLRSRIAAATILRERGQPEAVPAMIEAWRAIQPRLQTKDPDVYGEAGGVITFLAKSADAGAIEALGRDVRPTPIDVRLAVVMVFLPWPRHASVPMRVHVDGDIDTLPGGAAGAAIERLLVTALDDRERLTGMRGYWNEVSFEDPRIADLAALVLSRRWPDKYRFTWSANVTDHDAQIEMIRTRWRLDSPLRSS